MTYIGADGTVIQKRTLFRLSLVSDIFFGVMDAILLFGYTIYYPNRAVPKAKRRATRDGGG
jgi:Selenoprotein SelK_SelG